MDIFKLSRTWFDFCFENPEKIKPNHSALYFFCIEHCNRLGWKKNFGLPTTMAKEAIGISSYNTYINTLNDLVNWGFISMVQKSKNQYSSNIIALSNFNKALDKALDKALIKHATKHDIKQSESISSIDIQETNIPETINKKQKCFDFSFIEIDYKDTFENWIEYKKEKKQEYKTQKSLLAAYQNLKILSEYDPTKAKQIVFNSIANNWAGLFKIKPETKNNTEDGKQYIINRLAGLQ